ncbi:MAG: macro domain-containing protein [Planctomycetota bacterium]
MPETTLERARINQTFIRLVKGDITDLESDAFVFCAQPNLALGSGFGTAISVRGGPAVQSELQGLGPLATGEAVVTGAGKLKARYIIHAVGPRFQEEDTEGKLRRTVLRALALADEKQVARLALPAMGAGYYGIPANLCAQVMLEALRAHLSGQTGIEEIVICVLDTPQYQAFQAALAALREPRRNQT